MPAQIVLVAVGLWLMSAPDVLGYGEPASDNDRVTGPIVAAVAFLSIFAITRILRWLNLLTGLWLVVAPWVLDLTADPLVNSLACGVLTVVLAPVGRTDQGRYAGGWQSLIRPSGGRNTTT